MKEVVNRIKWFENVGQPLEKDGFVFKMVNKEECVKSSTSIKWENFILINRNRLSDYIKTHNKDDFKNWNTIARKCRTYFDENIKENVISGLQKCDLSNDNNILIDMSNSIRSILISYFIEYEYKEKGKNSLFYFDIFLIILSLGHIPCGWEGPMPLNEGYEPIDFNKGKILIW